ncbi:MAG: dTDP-4-dehydrorhamnose reductase, partial [bacterium]|nr:dTDP-4-dehydrorhamnose reductase [bacterium]
MKIAVVGAGGQLGTDICNALESTQHELVRLSTGHMEVSSREAVSTVLNEIKPQLVINTSAFHDVVKCETEEFRAFEVNGLGVRNLAMVCNDVDAALMHISTDYVFDGKKRAPYIETDTPMPLNVYANTKLCGEHYVEAIAKKFYIVRVSGIYGKSPCKGKGGRNFVETMLWLSRERDEVRVVDDEILTPTSTLEIARQIVKMVDSDAPCGIYHATAEGSCSWYEFAK